VHDKDHDSIPRFQSVGRQRLSQIYKAPRDFFWDIGTTLAYKLDLRRFQARGYWVLDIYFTPALPLGECGHFARSVRDPERLDAVVGLPREVWRQASADEKHRLVLELTSKILRHAQGDVTGPVLDRMFGAVLRAGEDLPWLTTTDKLCLPIDAALYNRLSLESWNEAALTERSDIIAKLSASLTEVGYDLAPDGIHSFGPSGQPQPVACWTDRRSDTSFALIPHGRFQPGISRGLVRQYRQVFSRMDEDVGEGPAPALKRTPIYLSDRDVDLSEKAPVAVPPFLLSRDVVLKSTSGLGRWLNTKSRQPVAATIPLPRLKPLLTAMQWALPTSSEFEWALRGGADSLFYWGSDAQDVERWQTFVRKKRPPERWPYYNRFGLTRLLECATWCVPSADRRDPCPIVFRGGALDCSPWQGCGEWRLLLNAAEGRARIPQSTGPVQLALRPVIRLGLR
jgi:hypothetical protein